MKKTTFYFFLFLIIQLFPMHLFSQKIHTTFSNPSFEEITRNFPNEWSNCDFNGIHRVQSYSLEKNKNHPSKIPIIPKDGDKFISMSAKKNGTWQSIKQTLSKPLKRKRCYAFSVHLSTLVDSKIRTGEDEYEYHNTPILLRVWGGVDYCHQTDLLAETSLINHAEWKEYTFTFSPNDVITSIQLEAFYDTGKHETAPNGNILLDNLSPIYIMNCKEVDSLSTVQYDFDPPEIELKRMILRKGPFIQFKGKYLGEHSINRIIEIGEAFKEFAESENKQLVICVYAKTFALADERKKDLTYSLRKEVGLKTSQFLIGNYSDFDEKQSWIFRGIAVNIGLKDLE